MELQIIKIITAKALLLLLITATAWSVSTASFGFDSANSCSPNGKLLRRGRSQMLAAIPCDLSKQEYCHLPGSAYPWHAVRRFVHENQGLIKRMYGDVRHISILRDEIQNNEVDVDDIQEAAERYLKDSKRAGKLMMRGREDFGSYKAGNDVIMEPHFRPVTTISTPPTTTKQKPTITTTPSPVTTPASALAAVELDRPNVESNSVYEQQPASDSPTSGDNIQIIASPKLGLHNISSNGSENRPSNTSDPTPNDKPTVSTETTPSVASTPEKLNRISEAQAANITTTTPPAHIRILPTGANATNTATTVSTPITFATLLSGSSTAVRKPVSSTALPAGSASSARPVLREGQLFQDAMKKEPVVVNSSMRGVNACPVKDEVVAPFWANNTRGEMLALLNLYPFEQYVHWEKCTHEFKQMFCASGCRCEQQYRLHRLLAYDPHNECRGIFSDWFRFPSSCICKCYNIPHEFRVTSRSPRSESSVEKQPITSHPSPHPIDVAEAEVQRAIYEHATEQWYRPRDDVEPFEG
ncbi:protein spaetzle 4 [Scaptodrosophila lebanonensis]|uniref:Protein spaetzle 4 n=1 Tax=Drosophila lebanonensis TaxID=7225 RepID=A0A6J2U8V3_DROLE|nr:protein spaetzle 4 [Scaptodrosophila lebanonensis]